MSASSIRVLVVEDYPAFRRFLVSTMQSRPELEVICEVANGSEAVQKARELQPELILLDIGLPELEWNRSRKTNPKRFSQLQNPFRK